MQTAHTSSSSAPLPPPAPTVDAPLRWTVRSALAASSSTARATALITACVALACTAAGHVPVTAGLTIVALLPAVLVDVVDRRLPDRLVGGAALLASASLATETLITETSPAPADMALGLAAMAGPLLVLHLASPAAMGFGDVKAAAVLGAALGLVDPVLALLALAIGSGVSALVGLTRRRRHLAFGPGLLGGAVVALVLVAAPVALLDLPGIPVAYSQGVIS